MTLTIRMRKQKAVWWQNTGIDRYSRKQYADGIEVKCRWEENTTESGRTENLATLEKNAKVYVDRDMKPGDVLWLGEIADLTDAQIESQQPERIDGAYPIQSFSKNFNVSRTKFLYIANL
jgi:hypothetical protein